MRASLNSTKTVDNKLTLLHYLIKVLQRHDPSALEFLEEGKTLKESAILDLNALEADLRKVTTGLKKIDAELKAPAATSAKAGAAVDRFKPVMEGFMQEAASQVSEAEAMFADVSKLGEELAKAYGEDPAGMGPLALLQLFSGFANELGNAKKFLDEKAINEEKEAKKAEAAAARAKMLADKKNEKAAGVLDKMRAGGGGGGGGAAAPPAGAAGPNMGALAGAAAAGLAGLRPTGGAGAGNPPPNDLPPPPPPPPGFGGGAGPAPAVEVPAGGKAPLVPQRPLRPGMGMGGGGVPPPPPPPGSNMTLPRPPPGQLHITASPPSTPSSSAAPTPSGVGAGAGGSGSHEDLIASGAQPAHRKAAASVSLREAVNLTLRANTSADILKAIKERRAARAKDGSVASRAEAEAGGGLSASPSSSGLFEVKE